MAETLLWIVWLTTFTCISLWRVGYKRPRTEKTAPEPKPICGCGHHLCYHDTTGCNAIPMYGASACGCKKYIQQDTTANAALYGDELK